MPHPIYAIGDVHGHKGQLDRVLHLIETDGGADAHIVFLGDYADRGPDSRAVLDTLVEGKAQGRNWTFLKGNHDRMFEWFMEVPPRHDPYMMVSLYWLHERLGGDTTLASYGVDADAERREKDVHADALAAVPQSHVDFLRGLQLTYETDGLFFAHAGIRPGVPLAQQDEEDLLWIRQEFHHYGKPHPKLIVHGHTPVREATHYGNRVNLDTAAGYGQPLTAAVFEGERVWRLTAKGRLPMEPAYA
ncbi:MAG: metallophosphoesterase family protein [Pseudomonadota bacterium]